MSLIIILMKLDFKKRLLLYLGIFAAVVLSSFFWGWPGQELNWRVARKEIDEVNKVLEGDSRFSQLRIRTGTANLGRDIWVMGSVPDQSSVDYLKTLMEQRISQKFNVKYVIQIEKGSEGSNQADEP
jgi:hypothetical protein